MRPPIAPSLPRSLLEELEASGSYSSKKGGHKSNRKQARKQERDEKKQRKADFFAHRIPQGKRSADEEHVDSPTRKKARLSTATQKPPPLVKSQTPGRPTASDARKTGQISPSHEKRDAQSANTRGSKPKLKQKTALEKLTERTDTGTSDHPVPLPTNGRSKAETQEDAYIKYLEAKLGWSKGGKRTKKYGSGLDEDGLDDLLEGIDTLETSIFSDGKTAYPTGEADEGDGTDDGAGDDEGSDDEEDDSGNDEEMDDVLEEAEDEDEEESVDEQEEWTGFSDHPENEDTAAESAAKKPAPGSRYVPPHLRNREGPEESSQNSEEQLKLTRQLKGLLNRLTEQNISTVLDSIEDLYRKHRRHDITSTLTTLIIDGISSHSLLLDSYVVLHAAFVSSLHKLIGVEFAAYFVQNVVLSYERHFAALPEASDVDEEEGRGKECSNLIVLLSELYNFQVISCALLYDMIRGLLDGELSEFKVELLLKTVRNSGQQLRTDDPSALKDIIQMVQVKLPAQQNAMSSRARFMIETLTNLKNNKVKKDASVSAAAGAVDRLKKFLTALSKKRQVRAHEPLRVTLDDLHSAESKGKWWLVGAAWSGDPLVEHQEDVQVSQNKTESVENTLLKLAKKQGMNTDIRRSIFVVLMSSEDYVDACERLSQLKLTEIQQREIVRVILHCCGNERAYNPYYAFVGQQLCRTSHSYKITLQFSLWDFLRDLGETSVGGAELLKNLDDDSVGFDLDKISSTRLRNVARAYAWWLAKDACTLAILKPIDFTVLKPRTQKFLLELFTHLFINTQLSTPLLSSDPNDYPATRNRGPLEEVLIKATRLQALAHGLVYFLGEHFRRAAEEDEEPEFISWAAKVAIDTLRTGVHVIAGL